MIEYKVITERDSRFSGKFDPDVLESALNSYAAEAGAWCRVSSPPASGRASRQRLW
jgi:hypothetical protein